jgi:sulfur carrier protein ThiS adenylyltransferase
MSSQFQFAFKGKEMAYNYRIEDILPKLKKATVGIAGLGGLGSNAAVSLVRAGVGSLVLVDFDCVETSNLNRQYYFLDQVGQLKSEALRTNLLRIRSDVRLDIHNMRLEPGAMDEPFHKVDVAIEALDQAASKAQFIEDMQSKLPHIPLVAAAGVAGVGSSDTIRTVRAGNLYLCLNPEAPSSDCGILLAPRVSVMANWEANLAIEIILGTNE